MTHDDEEHEALRRLFDETASRAAGPTLTKLGARAQDIPQQALRRASFLPRWASAFAVLAVMLCGLFALRAAGPRSAAKRSLELGSAAPSVGVATASAARVSAPAPRLTASEETGDGPELLGDLDDGARFDVSGPQSDRDLDAWLAATKDLSGGT